MREIETLRRENDNLATEMQEIRLKTDKETRDVLNK